MLLQISFKLLVNFLTHGKLRLILPRTGFLDRQSSSKQIFFGTMASSGDSPREEEIFPENDGSDISEIDQDSEFITPNGPPKPNINAIYREVQEIQQIVSIQFCVFSQALRSTTGKYFMLFHTSRNTRGWETEL